ncbi:uncharacterized protein LOC136075109 [Hydra vulgaris]|uniref:Uncharacterized protein LOC136075109 n=1 Tax=Hydra vulgaris TaxID=6087 RepID=A0ABM4B3P9_HYDVU
MIDGNVHTALSDVTNSSQCCSICVASPKAMNGIKKIVLKKGMTGSFFFGLSSLHAWIRFFECLLHIGYKMTLKKWQVRTVENKSKVKALKQQIQNRFKHEVGFIVDVPKPGGSGTSNGGNTSRRAIHNAEKLVEILIIDVELILNLHIILATILCGLDIDTDKFEAFCLKTARLYVHHYPWYYMPQYLHKILIHSFEIIKTLTLPIGMYSEEAQEARNKDFQN